MTTTRYREQPCPACGHKLSAASGVDHDRRPRPGDVSVCIMCAAVLIFERRGRLRLATAQEATECMAESPELAAAVLSIAGLHPRPKAS